jgi:hypothetical protein
MQLGVDPRKFWSKCACGAVTTCWLWTGPLGWGGYGLVYLRDGTSERAHRLAFMLTTQRELEPHTQVLQRCGNRLCVNPHHLYLGRARGAPQGSQHGRSKLNEDQVRAIRRLGGEGVTGRELARRYGVSPATISRILQGRTWTHILDS